MCAEKRKADDQPPGHLKRQAHRVQIQTNFPNAVLSSVPEQYQIIAFSELAAYEDYSNKCILGEIKHAYPIYERPKNGHLRKLLLVDAFRPNAVGGKEPVLTVFLFDSLAEASAKHGKGSMLALSNFHVEELVFMDPEDDFEVLNVQVLAMVSPSGEEGPQVWFAQQKFLSNGKEVPMNLPIQPESNNNVDEISLDDDDEEHNGRNDEDEDNEDNLSNGSAAAPIPETGRRSYQYTKLGDLLESGENPKYNVYGIIQSCSMHLNKVRKSYNLYLRLCDETGSDFPCTLFGGKTEDLIDAHVGDVIRIHRLMVDNVRGKLMGKCLKPTFVVVFNKDTKEKEPKSIAKTFVYTDEDKAIVKNLFVWSEITKRKTICDIKKEEFVDLFCQVIGVYMAKTLNAVILTIWDGTKTTEFENEHRGYDDERVDHKLLDIAKDYFVTMFVYGNHGLVAAELQPRDYIEVKDVQLYCTKCNPEKPMLALHPQQKGNRGIYVLDPSDDRLANLKRRLAKITEDVMGNPNHNVPEKDNFFLNCNVIGTSSQEDNDRSVTETSSGGQNCFQDDVSESSDTVTKIHQPKTILNEDASCKDHNDGMQNSYADPSNQRTGIHQSDVMNFHAEPQSVPQTNNFPEISNAEKNDPTPKNATISVDTPLASSDGQHNVNKLQKETLSRDPVTSSSSQISVSTASVPQVTADYVSSHGVSSSNREAVISIVNAGIEPGHSTQEFGGSYQEINKRIQPPVASAPSSSSLSAGVVPSTSQQQTQSQPNCTPNNLLRPTQFQGFGPQAKYSIFGHPQPPPEIPPEHIVEEWWKNITTVTETLGHSNVRPTKLVEISNHSVPYKFRVIAAALKMKPETVSIRKLIRLYCPHCHHLTEDADPQAEVLGERNGVPLYKCPKSPHISQSGQPFSPQMMYTYLITFTLHDGSGMNIDAFLWKENALNFFRGITPEQALSDDTSKNSVLSMLWKVCPNARTSGTLGFLGTSESGGFSLYPYLDCCIKSYTAGGMTRYQIFDTEVLQDNSS